LHRPENTLNQLPRRIVATLALACAVGTAPAQDTGAHDRHAAAIVAGNRALYTCSALFNAGQSEAQIERDMFTPLGRTEPASPLESEIDFERRVVRVAYTSDMPPRIAAWRPVLGCAQLPIGASEEAIDHLPRLPERFRAPDLDDEPWPLGDRDAIAALPGAEAAELDAIVEAAFDGATYGGTTWAVLVIKRGKIVAERYALDYDMHTSARTHSAIKSWAASVVGVAVGKGIIDIRRAPALDEWRRPGDPRGRITVEHLLHMASGLDIRGAGNPQEDLYFGGALAAGRTTFNVLESMPGERFVYAGTDTVLAVRAVRQAFADDVLYWRFPYEQLFWKIGMTRTIAETDWNGDFLMSGQAWSTARDFGRFGLLYLTDGVWNGERILPEGWVEYVATPAPAQPAAGTRYGAQFWLYGGESGLPQDAFSPRGAEGQFAMIVPSEDLVVVRRGFDRSGAFDIARFSADVMNALRERISTAKPASSAQDASTPQPWTPDIPRVWDEAALADWATPLAGLGAPPTHMSAEEYYALPEENLKSYPVYMPGREPEGYWEMIQQSGPQPLIEPEALETKEDWIAAGERVFMDSVVLRTFDPDLIEMARDREAMEERGTGPLPDGTVSSLRWLPTKDGVALGFTNCSACHLLYLPDNTPVPGASSFAIPNSFRNGLGPAIRDAEQALPGEAPFSMASAIGSRAYQAYGAPWMNDPAGERLKTITQAEFDAYVGAGIAGGGVARWNGSILYPAKIPDLVGFEDRKYIDHTATHRHRDIGDLMRYAALVSFAETIDFGGYRMIESGTERFQTRLPDEALYALALYVYSLEPPENPNPYDANARAGEALFERERCGRCHTPPLYTNNRLTLAEGFTPPDDVPEGIAEDIARVSVGTDPGLALLTRKGTGYYKVPSLKGLWYRGHYLHDGAVGSLEEVFDPGRLHDTHEPGGFAPPGTQTRAIKGHRFGLDLTSEEREQLIAFLRTL
jgi:CubicO group peptidase (beta-lactamase class C family)/mono/diheme cytochrome c family protein